MCSHQGSFQFYPHEQLLIRCWLQQSFNQENSMDILLQLVMGAGGNSEMNFTNWIWELHFFKVMILTKENEVAIKLLKKNSSIRFSLQAACYKYALILGAVMVRSVAQTTYRGGFSHDSSCGSNRLELWFLYPQWKIINCEVNEPAHNKMLEVRVSTFVLFTAQISSFSACFLMQTQLTEYLKGWRLQL